MGQRNCLNATLNFKGQMEKFQFGILMVIIPVLVPTGPLSGDFFISWDHQKTL